MPVNPGLRTLIEIPVSDRVYGDTTIKQKAIFNSLYHQQQADGQCSAVINVTVRSFAVRKLVTTGESGTTTYSYGESLADKGVPDRQESLSADNNSLVDMATGGVLVTRKFETNLEWDNIISSFTQPTMLQGDFFELLRENAPIEIGALIRQHIALADAPPFSRFS